MIPVQHGGDGRITLSGQSGRQQGDYTHDLFTTAALNFIKINKPDQFNRYRPFFLYLSYTIPHANNEEGRRTGNGMQVPERRALYRRAMDGAGKEQSGHDHAHGCGHWPAAGATQGAED